LRHLESWDPVFSKEGFAPLVAGLISMIVRAMCNQVAIAAACRWGRGAMQCRRLLWGRQTQLQPS